MMNKPTIYFDMDGTIADLYGVKDWLSALRSNNPMPYREAKVMHNMSHLARLLNKLQTQGHKIGIISWCSKTGNAEFNLETEYAKRKWLAEHLRSVHFDEIHILPYGVAKHTFVKNKDILFDDEQKNRDEWREAGGHAYSQEHICRILKIIYKWGVA